MKLGRAVIFFYAAAFVVVCPTAKPRLKWLALNRPNWLPFKPALTKGWIQEIPREDRTAFKVYWRVRKTDGGWTIKSKTLPPIQEDGKPTIRKHADKFLSDTLRNI